MRVLIFANLDFIVVAVVAVFVVAVAVVVVDDLQPVVVGELGSSWAWSSVWGDSNGKWKCCHSPTFNSTWKAAKGISYRTKERGNDWDFPFSSEIQAAKKATGEERSEIKGNLGYVAKPKLKKEWLQENYLTWVAYIFRSALALFKSSFVLYLPRVEKSQDFGFSRFFNG